MSDESEIGTVLKNAPKIKEAFGSNRGTLITLVSLYLARPRTGFVGLVSSVLLASAIAMKIWFYRM